MEQISPNTTFEEEWIKFFGNNDYGNCCTCGFIMKKNMSATNYTYTHQCRNKPIMAQCHQCFMVEPQNDDLKEYNEYMIEKNRLSRFIWNIRYGNHEEGVCVTCKNRLNKYIFYTWYKNSNENNEVNNLDICCSDCYHFMKSEDIDIETIKRNYKSKYKKILLKILTRIFKKIKTTKIKVSYLIKRF